MKRTSRSLQLATAIIFSATCSLQAALTVVDSTGTSAGPTTEIEVLHDTSLLPAFGVEFWDVRFIGNAFGDPAWHGTISGAAPDIFRETEDPSGFIDSSALIRFYGRGGPVGPPQYLGGAVAGTDNWVYLSRNGEPDPANYEPTSWVQFEFGFDVGGDVATATVLRYVHDPANPFADITLPQAIAAVNGVPEPGSMALLAVGLGGMLVRRKR